MSLYAKIDDDRNIGVKYREAPFVRNMMSPSFLVRISIVTYAKTIGDAWLYKLWRHGNDHLKMYTFSDA